MKPPLLQSGRNLRGIVEAAYRLDGGEPEWLERVAQATDRAIEGAFGTVAFSYRVLPGGHLRISQPVPAGGRRDLAKVAADMHAQPIPAIVARMYVGGTTVASAVHDFGASGDAAAMARVEWALKKTGAGDFLGVLVGDPTGNGCVISLAIRERRTIPPAVERVWARVTTHLAAGMRLRRAAERTEAVVTPGGRIEHAEGSAKPADAREALRRAAMDIDRARVVFGRGDPGEALEIWRGLVFGRWSMVDRFDADGRRYFIARRNDPQVRDPRSLTARERQVAAYVALGRSTKLIGYALGLSESAVATHVSAILAKLRVRSRAELAALLSRLGGT